MAPLAASSLSAPWSAAVPSLAVIWGAMILVFLAGDGAMASATLGLGALTAAPAPLIAGLALARAFDRRAALSGDAPRHFARLRGPQMAIAALALGAALLRRLPGLGRALTALDLMS